MAGPGKPGRRTRLTPEVHKTIVDLVRKAVPISVAAAKARVADATVYEWLRRGEEGGTGNEVYESFHDDLREAEADAETELLDVVRNEAMGDNESGNPSAQTAMALLSRRWASRWSRQDNAQPPTQEAGSDASATVKELLGSALLSLVEAARKAPRLPVVDAEIVPPETLPPGDGQC